jgi:hypothetical protein
VALAALLVAVGAAAVVANVRRAPDPGREATYWLAIESLAIDGDTRLEEIDRARYTTRFGRRPPEVQVTVEEGTPRLASPWLWTRLAALARELVGHAGVPLMQWSLFTWTALAAALTLASRLGGGSSGWLVSVTLLASAAFATAFRLEPRALEMAAMASAAAAVWYRRLGPARPAEDVYRGDLDPRPSSLRWLVAGAFGGVVAAASPTYLPLLAVLVAAAPPGRRGRAGALFAVGLVAVGGAVVLGGGAPWEAPGVAASASLYGWALLGLLLGRGVGLLPYFIPAVLLVTLGGYGDGKRWVLPAVAGAAAMQIALAPFDFLEGGLLRGNAWFLPPLALLLLAVESSERPRATLAVGAAGLPLLLVAWLAAVGASGAAAAVDSRIATVERLLPVASTLRWQPGIVELRRGGVVARGIAPGLDGGDGKLRLRGTRGQLLVTSDRPLSSLRFELGRDAPAGIEVRGGRLGNVTYRPNGEVALDVAVDSRKARRHPVWWSPGAAWTHALELRLESAPPQPVTVDLAFGRPELPASAPP